MPQRKIPALLCAAAILTAATAARADDLPSYEAVYDLRLTHASASTGPRAAVGTFTSHFAETCDGWDVKSHTLIDLAFRDDTNFTNERFFSSWESKSGTDYRFAARTTKNGKVVEAFKGTAKLGPGGGKAVYEVPAQDGEKDPDKITIVLPRDTLLPVAHSRALLTRAEHGDGLFRAVVLDGASSTGPRVTSIAIGARQAADNGEGSMIDPTLLGTPSWRLSSAFFNLNEQRDTPNSEVLWQLHDSGVTRSFEQTFSDFVVSATLKKLRRLDKPVCSKG